MKRSRMTLPPIALVAAVYFLASSITTAGAFVIGIERHPSRRSRSSTWSLFSHSKNDKNHEFEHAVTSTTRRRLVSQQFPLVALIAAGVLSSPTAAQAATNSSPGALFQSNPLTNRVLEQIRIWEQAEADNVKYGGELERGDAGNQGQTSAYPQLLVPILVMAQELDTVAQTALTPNGTTNRYADLQHILGQPKYNKIEFKRVFNAFADNVYYADPDRANLYLAGGATPKTEQSLAYLLRNEILTNIEDLRAEVEYLSRNRDESDEDLRRLATAAANAMQRYLTVVPPAELEQARALLVSNAGGAQR